jgi:mono/diheme cytochrome c family protein
LLGKTQEIVFTFVDGFQPHVPVKKFLSHNAFFAIANEDNEPFTLTKRLQNNEVVALVPLYLVCDNIRSKAPLEAGAPDMPYQIIRAELKFETAVLNMSPPQGSAEQVQRGFKHFRKHCAACHAINGEGGGKAGTQLSGQRGRIHQAGYLKRWIESTQSIRYNSTMPGFAKAIPDREKVMEELIAYLKAMSTAKRSPVNIDQKTLQSR